MVPCRLGPSTAIFVVVGDHSDDVWLPRMVPQIIHGAIERSPSATDGPPDHLWSCK